MNKPNQFGEEYWQERYEANATGWDVGHVSTPLKTYFDQIEDKSIRILIPGAGNAHEVEYLHKDGFKNVFLLDIAPSPIEDFVARNPDFPKEHLLHEDFFEHEGEYDIIVEQTFFCSFNPEGGQREQYAIKMNDLLSPTGRLIGLWFDDILAQYPVGPPFGGKIAYYLALFSQHLSLVKMEKCYNSIKPRQGLEAFGIFVRKG